MFSDLSQIEFHQRSDFSIILTDRPHILEFQLSIWKSNFILEMARTISKNWNCFIICFVHPIFCFWSLLATKLQKYCVIFVYILQGKRGKKKKNPEENHETKVTKMPKTKRRKYGMNETILTK